MSEFSVYFELGLRHITDLNGIDHILFIVALCGIFTVREWKTILWLVTAFTIGHSVTLALSVLDIILLNSNVIEFLIPVTILITSLLNIFSKNNTPATAKIRLRYFAALFFGLIHGMGFSNYLKFLLGKETSIVNPLLGFNLGLEAGQLVIVGLLVFFTFILLKFISLKNLNYALSSLTGVWALFLIVKSKFLLP